jgi:hypothetical protein
VHPVLGEPTFFSFISDDFGSSVGFGMSILLAGLIGFHARVGGLLSLLFGTVLRGLNAVLLAEANGGAHFGRRGWRQAAVHDPQVLRRERSCRRCCWSCVKVLTEDCFALALGPRNAD